MPREIPGMLLLHHAFAAPNASMIAEHIEAFCEHAPLDVFPVNVEHGFPPRLAELSFQVVLLHYSMFGWKPFALGEPFIAYLEARPQSFVTAFFQDEYRFWPERSAVLRRCHVDQVYTCLEPEAFDATYRAHSEVGDLVSCLPGYVGRRLLGWAAAHRKPDAERRLDVGYRGRQAYPYMGRGAREKHEIGERFLAHVGGRGLAVDIEVDEGSRIYGEDWIAFLADCRAVLGVESGVSIFDTEDVVMPQVERLLAAEPGLSFEALSRRLLARYEGTGPRYRTISPRVFEAAAVGACQILYEGRYSGLLEPMVHYIPLRKDFANIDEVLARFADADLRAELAANAHRDLIASGAWSYERFVAGFWARLEAAGVALETLAPGEAEALRAALAPPAGAAPARRVGRWWSRARRLVSRLAGRARPS